MVDRQSSDFDLEKRTAAFGESVIEFCQTVGRTAITKPLISQLVRSACRVGANYCEADESATNREFRYRISLVVEKPERQSTGYECWWQQAKNRPKRQESCGKKPTNSLASLQPSTPTAPPSPDCDFIGHFSLVILSERSHLDVSSSSETS